MFGRYKLATANPPRAISKMGPGLLEPIQGPTAGCVSAESGAPGVGYMKEL
jgi:hypothetical protein